MAPLPRRPPPLACAAANVALALVARAASAQPVPPPPPPPPPASDTVSVTAPSPFASAESELAPIQITARPATTPATSAGPVGRYDPSSAVAPGSESPAWWPYAGVLYSGRPMPYNGGTIPPGTSVETRPIVGLITGGASIFGVSYLIDVVIALAGSGSQPYGLWAIPIVGPLVFAGVASPITTTEVVWAVLSGILQAGSVAMFIGGLGAHRAWVVPASMGAAPRTAARGPRWTVVPAGPAGSAGASVSVVAF